MSVAKNLALSAQVDRIRRQSNKRAADIQQAQSTAYYVGGGQYRKAGGNGGYRPAGVVTSGGVRQGQIVPANGGLVGGMPAGAAQTDLRALTEQLGVVAYNRGPQVGEEEPDTIAPRYPQDLYHQQDTGTVYRYQLAEDEDGSWVGFGGDTEAFPFRIEAPENQTYILDPYQHYPVRIEAVEATGAAVTVAPGVGNIAEVGSAISIMVDDSGSDPVIGSIKLRRV